MLPIRETIRRTPPYAPEGERANFLRLDANENPYGPTPRVTSALAALTADDCAHYPDKGPLRERIARREGFSPDAVELSNGSDDILRNLIDMTVRPGDAAVLPVPTFSMNTLFLTLREARIVTVPFGAGMTFPADDLITMARREQAKLVLLVNPGAPLGNLIAPEDIERVAAALPDTLVVVDEAYGEFAGVTAAPLVRRYPNLVVTRTFSKAWGLAGLRLGYCLGAPELIAALRALLSPYPVAAATLTAALAALADEEWMRRSVEKIRNEREELRPLLAALGYRAAPSAANFLTVTGAGLAATADYLKSVGILVRYFPALPTLPEGAIRITVGRPEDSARLIAALQAVRRPPAILFDMDGVLIDVRDSYLRAVIETVRHYTGSIVTVADIDALRKQGGFNNDWDLSEALIRERGVTPDKKELIARFQKMYLGDDLDGFIASEQLLIAKETLAALAARYRIGIVTGRPRIDADAALERFGITEYFTAVVTMDDTREHKPLPVPVRRALELLGAPSALYLGDTVDDMAAARGAGCIALGIPYAADRNDAAARLREAGAAAILGTVNAITEVVL